MIRQLPNALSFARLFTGVLFPWIPQEYWFAVVLLGAFSDLIDGEISRFFHSQSDFGQMLDPLADKAFILGAVASVVVAERMTLAELVLIALRDFAVLLVGFVVGLRDGFRNWRTIKPRLTGKATTALQFVFLLVVIGDFNGIRPYVFWLTAAASAIAAVDYAWREIARPVGREKEQTAGSGKM